MADDAKSLHDEIKASLAAGRTKFEIKAWAHWGTPEQVHMLTIPMSLTPNLDAQVIFERAESTARAAIIGHGFSPADAASAKLTFDLADD
jgi:hypothetical protein